MDFVLSSKNIKTGKVAFIFNAGTPTGVKKITSKVCGDMKAIFGSGPEAYDLSKLTKKISAEIEYPILVSTGKEPGENAREVFSMRVLKKHVLAAFNEFSFPSAKSILTIDGSDKRGTIYGLFHLSEMLGVSPFIDWLDIRPERKTSFTLKSGFSYTSKEPSVRFRGFFINDEWPAFGNYCTKRFGGFNAKCYEHVFELLLRLKGNYLWPAMWSAIFPNDGPGLKNEELADELGVVMGMSHHEPCLRQGEEYKYLRGKNSIYGDAWNFLSNEKGITKFWEDGLKRSGKFENVVTVGMRGEADTAIMGKDATLKDNIDLLRKVLKTQNKLIRKYVNEDLDKVPRMLALYKEVEPYFYGDEKTPGLMGDPELEGVTLMLCDDNYGNLRTVPTKEMRGHKGGYGMYYHFDYHGLPISFEWFNTTHLSKVWEQMTTAYDFGIRDLWIVNVGDIFSNEYPLSYFLDLAYDFEKWGTGNRESAGEYTRLFVEKNFGEALTRPEKRKTEELLKGYTRITHSRRTEAMNDEVYAPLTYGETDALLDRIGTLMKDTKKLYEKLSGNAAYRFYELVYLPLMANLNVQKMWLLTSQNHAYAKAGSTYALELAKQVDACVAYDKKLVDELHKIHDGMWYGMGLSEHIGFKNWCEEGCQYPVLHTFEPANKPRLIVSVPGTEQFTEGRFWTGKALVLPHFLDPRVCEAEIALSTAGEKKAEFKIECDASFLSFSEKEGMAKAYSLKKIVVKLDREKYARAKNKDAQIKILGSVLHEKVCVAIRVPVRSEKDFSSKEKNTFFWCGDVMNYISIEAKNYSAKTPGTKGDFALIPDYNRGFDALKAYPQDKIFNKKGESPVLTYRVVVPESGKYTLVLMTNPSNPPSHTPEIFCGVAANGGKQKKINMIREGFAVGDGNEIWMKGVLDNMRTTAVPVDLKKGENTIDISAISPNFVLMKMVLFKEGEVPEKSYLGPSETYFKA